MRIIIFIIILTAFNLKLTKSLKQKCEAKKILKSCKRCLFVPSFNPPNYAPAAASLNPPNCGCIGNINYSILITVAPSRTCCSDKCPICPYTTTIPCGCPLAWPNLILTQNSGTYCCHS